MIQVVKDIEQGTDEWHQLRLGIPTASCYDRIVTASGKPSSQADAYINELTAEWIAGKPYGDWQGNAHTERGHLFEDDARAAYEFLTDRTVKQAAFVYRDKDRLTGCSPDGLIYKGRKLVGGTEIKCPIDTIHLAYVVAGVCPAKYLPQVQGSMWICGVDSWDFISYHQEWEPFVVKVEREEKWSKSFDDLLPGFIERLLEKRESPAVKALRDRRLQEAA